MMGFGFGIGGLVFMVLAWVVLVLLAVWLVRALFAQPQPPPPARTDGELSVTEIIERRYVKGEITLDQYEAMKKVLLASRSK